MHRRGQPLPSPVPEYVEDLDVDKETAEEGKTKLSPNGEKTKAYSVISLPVFGADLNIVKLYPLKVTKHVCKE